MESVSVIIPTYNRAQLLPRALDSVLQQKDFSGEIIVVDDGSLDNTREVLAPFINNRGVRYLHLENSGPAQARNVGVEAANYDLIAFLDSDDHWHHEKLLRQTTHLSKHKEYSICHTYEKWLRRGCHLNQKNIHFPRHGDIFSHCLKICAVGMSTVLMKKRLYYDFQGLDSSLPCCEDYDLWLRISSMHSFLLLPERLTVKEGGRRDQVSSIFRIGMDKYRIYAIRKILNCGQLTKEQYYLAVKELQRKCKIYGSGCIKHGRVLEGKFYQTLAEEYRP